MNGMFESTLPAGVPDLLSVSAFRRYLDEIARDVEAESGAGRLSGLNPSLLQDLLRFDGRQDGEGLEVLEVLAACVRHGRALLLHLQDGRRVVPLTVFPAERLVHCPVSPPDLLAGNPTALRVLHVEPALQRPLGHPDRELVGEAECHAPLGPLLWELALHGAREDLLPEIAGPAAYRLAPGVDLTGLKLAGSLAAAVYRLRRSTSSLREIAEWPGFDRGRAMRLLNGLYLQAGLIVSRSHPAAADGWF